MTADNTRQQSTKRPASRRILAGIALLSYCVGLLIAFDLIYSMITAHERRDYRVPDAKYHHSFAANFDGYDFWGNRRYKLLTNNLGFRDATVRDVAKSPKERRILLIGDSFVEGIGLPFEETFAGMFYKAGQDAPEKVEFLNAGVSSYSPSIYYKKIQTLLNDGYRIDEVVLFSDESDVQDEATSYFCIDDDPAYRSLCNPGDLLPFWAKRKTFRNTYLTVTDATINWISKKIKPVGAKLPPYEFFRIDWLYPNPRVADYRPLGVQGGIRRSVQNMTALAEMLAQRGIPLTIVVYPWSVQLLHDDRDNAQTAMWREFCRERCKNFVNLFPVFFREKEADKSWFERLFIPGDIHFSEAGNKVIFRTLAQQLLQDKPSN